MSQAQRKSRHGGRRYGQKPRARDLAAQRVADANVLSCDINKSESEILRSNLQEFKTVADAERKTARLLCGARTGSVGLTGRPHAQDPSLRDYDRQPNKEGNGADDERGQFPQ